MYQNREVRTVERRRKRRFIPIIYFMAEVTAIWLVLTLIELNFNIFEWSMWSLFIFIILFIYSTFKTIHIYKRQKNYPES